jgi:hypothetical protein
VEIPEPLGLLLKVAIDEKDQFPARLSETFQKGGVVAKVARELNNSQLREFRRQLRGFGPAIVRGSVVHENNFEVLAHKDLCGSNRSGNELIDCA